MSDLTPSTISAPETVDNDPRVGHWLQDNTDADSLKAVLVGFPSDEGVQRNGGRAGAAEAPDEIRKQLYGLTPSAVYYEPFVELLEHSTDVGVVAVSGDL